MENSFLKHFWPLLIKCNVPQQSFTCFLNRFSLHVVKILEKYLWRISYFCEVACCGPATFLKMNSCILSIFQWLWVQLKNSYVEQLFAGMIKAAWGVLQRYVFIEHLPGYFFQWLQKLQFNQYNYIYKHNIF